MSCKLMLLSCGTNACYHFAKVLKEKFNDDFYILGVDINESYLIPSINYLDAFYKVPRFDSPDYYSIIIDICKKENPDYILPSFDFDQKLFYPENQDLVSLGVKSLGCSKDILKFYESKEKMVELLNSLDILTPKNFSKSEINPESNYFIKPKNGVGSIGARIVLGANIINFENLDEYVVQDICFEPEYTVECFNYCGEFRAVTRERIASKSGVCTKTKVFNFQELELIAKNFSQKAKLPYCFNLQFMKNSNNEFVVTDVNLRLAGGMSLSYVAGWDEISALANVMLGRSSNVFKTLPVNVQPQYVLRAYTDIVTKVEKPVMAFDFDGTILDSRMRHSVVMNDILPEYNIQIDTSDLIQFKRQNKNNVDYLVSKSVSKELAIKIQAKWIQNIEKDVYLELDVLYPDALNDLDKYSKDYDLILITARNNKEGLYQQINKFGLKKYFKEIFVVPSNQNSSISKSEILKQEKATRFVGDTLSDKTAADIAQIQFIHAPNGFHSKSVL